jgi:hypothetical protein
MIILVPFLPNFRNQREQVQTAVHGILRIMKLSVKKGIGPGLDLS